jgi:signal transduction histidine kinase
MRAERHDEAQQRGADLDRLTRQVEAAYSHLVEQHRRLAGSGEQPEPLRQALAEFGAAVKAWRTAGETLGADQARLEARVGEHSVALAEAVRQKDHFLASAQEARAEAEGGRLLLAFLAEATKVLASSLDYQTTLSNVARLAVPTLADWCIVDMLDENGQIRQLAVAHTDAAKVELAWHLDRRYPDNPNAPAGVPRVIRTGKSELYPQIPDDLLVRLARDEEHLQQVRSLGLHSGIIVALRAQDRMLGALSFGTAESKRRYGAADLDLAEELARRAAVAIDNARLYQEVREADQRKDEFLAMLAHELRNPLAPIRNALQVLRLRGSDQATAHWAQNVIGRQVEHMARLVDDLLDVSRITRGKIQLRKQRLDLREVARRALENARSFLDPPGHQVEVSLPAEPVCIEGDLTRLEQILMNLLHNAAKYTEPGGHIWLVAERQENEALLRVRDTGIGMRADLLPRVFDLFVQSDRALDRAQGGLGIGLTLVRRLVERHGGSVQAFSPGAGLGSEFVVRLPLADVEPEAVPQPNAPPEPCGRSLRVLVVDDNEDAAESLALLLGLWGHQAKVAHEGRTALAVAQEQHPDAVLLDIGLPGMDGYQVARRLRQLPGLEKTLLVAMTGYGQEEDRRRSHEVGFQHHLVKPVDPMEVRELLARGS